MGAIPSNKPFAAKSAHTIFPKATKSTPPSSSSSSSSSTKRNDLPFPMMKKRGKRAARGVITIPTSSDRRRWDERGNCEFNLSLQDLHLQDLSEDTNNAQLSITLSIQKHIGFGLSVEGRVITSIARKCRNCSKPYCKEIDANFNAWVLPSRQKSSSHELPLIGLDDPSVIYVKPGNEANLDSLVQDTLRVATSVNETCSESCEKSEPKMQQARGKPNAASIDRRWSRLLELKQSGL